METKQQKWARYMRNYRSRHPEKVKKARKLQYNNRKLKAMQRVSENAVCERCGCDELDFLEFNHRNGGGCKEHRENKNTPIMDRILTNKRDTDDLEIVCRVCNALDYLERKNNTQAKRYDIQWK